MKVILKSETLFHKLFILRWPKSRLFWNLTLASCNICRSAPIELLVGFEIHSKYILNTPPTTASLAYSSKTFTFNFHIHLIFQRITKPPITDRTLTIDNRPPTHQQVLHRSTNHQLNDRFSSNPPTTVHQLTDRSSTASFHKAKLGW